MRALVLEERKKLSIRDVDISEEIGPSDVRVAIKRVGICGSDLHYYEFGRIGNAVVREPMILGHEASGTVLEVGKSVNHLKSGDRVCMEPGIPDPKSRAVMLGRYNIDPSVKFWATPPVHGCLRESVVHPADYTFKLPDNVDFEEGAMIEPLAVAIHAVNKAQLKCGDVCIVVGAGTIGILTALTALACGCSKLMISDVVQERLEIVKRLGNVIPFNNINNTISETVRAYTDGWGADIVFEASGNEKAVPGAFDLVCPGGRVVLIGCPVKPVPVDISAMQQKEVSIETTFRYAHVFPKAINLVSSGKIDTKSLISKRYRFERAIEAFEYAARREPDCIKVQINLEE